MNKRRGDLIKKTSIFMLENLIIYKGTHISDHFQFESIHSTLTSGVAFWAVLVVKTNLTEACLKTSVLLGSV